MVGSIGLQDINLPQWTQDRMASAPPWEELRSRGVRGHSNFITRSSFCCSFLCSFRPSFGHSFHHSFGRSFHLTLVGPPWVLCIELSKEMNKTWFKLPMVKSSAVRKVSAKTLPAHQQEAISDYMHQKHYREPQDIVDTAVLLDTLTGFTSDDESQSAATTSSDFSAFLSSFPVSCGGQPPTKKQRLSAGFPTDHVLYDKWRNIQLDQRQEYLLSQFTHRKLSAAIVGRLIAQEGWTANHPKPEDIVRLWKPPSKVTIETD
ncbi:hypothetical protein Q8A67_017017 [Cirrhinus molitorella]|uniref:Uncharacterized protein n=1 Tax=Cirrhinus molitorella TaxID=172907 RepID=A0AA88PL39_9TELE|nr:hypothetical protein Q8A67_017017 [Cirrhinus molitorella]